MATVREGIQIVVTEKGAKIVRRKLDNIGTAGKKAQGGVKLLNNALGTLAVVGVVAGLVRMVDTYTNLQNRLRLVTTGTENLGAVTKRLFEIANATRTTYEGTATLYARVALSTKNLGKSQEELLNFTESVNQAIILSGASAIEANAGLIQLSQGLASSRLSGDELRSVLEQIPAVADVIAKSLGITRGELRKMGETGVLTAEIVLKAFKDAREELAERFAQTVPTIGQAVVVLKNSVLECSGALNTASGAGSAIASTLIFIAGHVEILATALLALSVVILINLTKSAIAASITAFGSMKVALVSVTKIIPGTIAAVKALNLAIRANPIGALVTVIGLVVVALVKWRNVMAESTGVIGIIGRAIQTLVGWFQKLGEIAGKVFEAIKLGLQEIGILQKGTSGLEVKLDGGGAAASIKNGLTSGADEAAAKLSAAAKKDRDAQLKSMARSNTESAKSTVEAHTAGGQAAAAPLQQAYESGGVILEAAGVKFTQATLDIAGSIGEYMTVAKLMVQAIQAQVSLVQAQGALLREQARAIDSQIRKTRAETSRILHPQLGITQTRRSSFGGGGIPGLAHGGNFTIGGTNGIDNNQLSINNEPVARVTRGETITVTPKGETSRGDGRPILINFNIQTPDADSFQRSQPQILARTQAAMQRASARNN